MLAEYGEAEVSVSETFREIEAEVRRIVDGGLDTDSPEFYGEGGMSGAAVCYLLTGDDLTTAVSDGDGVVYEALDYHWPIEFDLDGFEAGLPRRAKLVRAAAYVLLELARLDELAAGREAVN